MGTQGGMRGAQFDHRPLSCFRVIEHFQGNPAALGVTTVFPWTLEHRPRSAEAVVVFAGEVSAGGAGEIQRQGVDYSVDIETRKVTWLPTARKALSTTSTVTVRYWRRAIYDHGLFNKGL